MFEVVNPCNHFTWSRKATYFLFFSQKFSHDDVIKWKHFPRYWPFVRGIHRSPVNFPHKGQRRGALMFTLICARINGWVNNRETGDLRRYCPHYDVIVMKCVQVKYCLFPFYFQTTFHSYIPVDNCKLAVANPWKDEACWWTTIRGFVTRLHFRQKGIQFTALIYIGFGCQAYSP